MPKPYDLICHSHLRWDFVYQRPQHLMTRFARERRVYFVEEAFLGPWQAHLECRHPQPQLIVVIPHLPAETPVADRGELVESLLLDFLCAEGCEEYALWYYTPMALDASRNMRPLAVVYDCMDELSGFLNAPETLRLHEVELLARADLVFTGGHSLYEAKRLQHRHAFAFPSSVDTAHYALARQPQLDPDDQRSIPHPRVGFFGVLDERLDVALLTALADTRPNWNFVLLGPVVKIEPTSLPQRPNIFYLGMKGYQDLPRYLAGWDVAMLPFAQNAATRFISPTKTLEYLAGGKPTISTAIHDVVHPYGDEDLVTIADWHTEWVWGIEDLLATTPMRRAEWLSDVDRMLSFSSWDNTWREMRSLLDGAVAARQAALAGFSASADSPSSGKSFLNHSHWSEAEAFSAQPSDYTTTDDASTSRNDAASTKKETH